MTESREQTDEPTDEPTDGPTDGHSDEEVEQERQERLDPDNRPEEAEVDNTDRDFDEEKGMFTDSEGYEEADERFPAMGEQGA
ncbi:MAG: hypothetical protein KDB43_09840 [Nocardioidaceae bacterium]|nr:hypothetical protein [Nocardioidaceae bacterium]